MTEDEIQARWEENRRGVQDAKQAVIDTFRAYTRVRSRVSDRARRRDPRYPVLTAEERADVDQARIAWDRAGEDLKSAQERFKAGVPEA